MSHSTMTRDGASHLKKSMTPSAVGEGEAPGHAQPRMLALDATAAQGSVENLNQILADTMTLRDLYKKHHWQASGPTFYPMHLLYDKHSGEQSELVDLLAERIQSLGGVAIAMAPDVAGATRIPPAPRGPEETPKQLARLLQAHEVILREARAMAKAAEMSGDVGTNDMIVSDVIRTSELQTWFLTQHVC